MKTAMKELEDKLKDNLKWIVMNADYELMDKLFKEGFEKEKEQIMKAVQDAYECTYNSCDSGCGANIEIEFTPQEYYNQTYKPETI